MSQSNLASVDPESDAQHKLSRAARRWLFKAYLLLAACYLLLEAQAPGLNYLSWIALPLVGSTGLYLFLLTHLQKNRRKQDAVTLDTFGLGNEISIFRGFELALLSGFLLVPQPVGWTAWIPAVLYTSADILDYLDGYAARVRDEVTDLGEELDQLLDGAGLFIATLLAIRYGTLTWLFLPFGAARYLFLTGLWLRQRRGQPVHPLSESRSRRPIAGLSMGFMTAMLWPIVTPPASILAGWLFMLPFGASFLRDWLVVSGVLDPRSERYLNARERVEKGLIDYFPLLLRFVFAGLLIWDAGHIFVNVSGEVERFAAAGFPAAGVVVSLFASIKLIAVPLLLLGIAGRFVAFGLVFPIGLTAVLVSLTDIVTGLLIGDLLILMLGTGMYSLWEPSKQIFGRKAGSPR